MKIGPLEKLIVWGSAFACGGMLASLAFIDHGATGNLVLRYHWTAIPLLVFGIVATATFWHLLFGTALQNGVRQHRSLKIAGFILLLIGVCAFAYPMRFIPPEKRGEALGGLSIAVLVLSGVGFLIVKTIQWINQNEPKDGDAS